MVVQDGNGLRRPIFTADPRAGYFSLKAEIDAAVRDVLESPVHVLGPPVERFERQFADYVGVRHGIGVNNCTDALHLALRALGLGADDEVITVSHTSVATVAAIEMAGARPVCVDIEKQTYTIDPQAVLRAITPRTKAVLAVHLYGQPADIDALSGICRRHDLLLIEDCAQSHGASWHGRMTGAFGAVGCFSFYPTKNLGTVGDGGMVVTNDGETAQRVRQLRQYGWSEPQLSRLPGWNSRLGPIEAAILEAKLPHLTMQIERRRQIASRYRQDLDGLPLRLPDDRAGAIHAYHLFVVECADPDVRTALRAHLAERGVQTGIHYEHPVHLQPAYQGRVGENPLPVTEAVARTIISLPTYAELQDDQQTHVVTSIREFFGAAA